MVAGVFVRVYNEQPTFPISDPPAFCKGLVSYLHVQTQSLEFRAAQTDTQESPAEGAKHSALSMLVMRQVEPANPCQMQVASSLLDIVALDHP